MKYLWTFAVMLIEPFVTATYWLAYQMQSLETYLAVKAGEPRDE